MIDLHEKKQQTSMAQLDAPAGIDALIQRTADMVELTISPSMSSHLTHPEGYRTLFRYNQSTSCGIFTIS